jgi:queuine/archaeosine tRNA-ribosyltransferase
LLKLIPNISNLVEIPLTTLIANKETYQDFKRPLSETTSLFNFKTLITIKNSGQESKDSYNEGNKLAMWSKKGKIFLTNDDFNEFISKVPIDLKECPFDDINSVIESKKRIRKVLEKSKVFVDSIFGQNDKNENNSILMPLVGNIDKETRSLFIEHIKKEKYKFNGTSFHGLEQDKETFEIIDLKKFEELIKDSNVSFILIS